MVPTTNTRPASRKISSSANAGSVEKIYGGFHDGSLCGRLVHLLIDRFLKGCQGHVPQQRRLSLFDQVTDDNLVEIVGGHEAVDVIYVAGIVTDELLKPASR